MPTDLLNWILDISEGNFKASLLLLHIKRPASLSPLKTTSKSLRAITAKLDEALRG